MNMKLVIPLLFLLSCSVLKAQNLKLTGKVISKSNDAPLPNANVVVNKGNATKTDVGGLFTVVAAKGATVTVSFSGYASQNFIATNETLQIISLEEVTKQGDEVVVVGYGTKKRKDLTTSISSISAKEITATPVADAAQALQGKVSGVTIVQGSGAPGGTGGTQLRIRGISSLTGTNNPLIVVDGYPLPDQGADNVLNSFGTGDIESIDVLKDAAAAAIYGVRASNGVVMITTKRGKAGKTLLTVDVYRGLQQAWSLPTMLNAREYAIINSEARIASGLQMIPKLADFNAIQTQYGEGTNWLNEIFRKAAMQNVSINASGGSDKSQFSLSLGYFKQDGIIYNTDFERFNVRFNGDIKVNNRIKIGNSLSMNKFIEHGTDTYTAFNSAVILALTAPPTVSPRNPDGSYSGGNGSVDGFDEPNPVYNLEVPKNSNTKYRITGNVFTEINILKDLKFKTTMGADFNYQEINSFSPATTATGGRPFFQTGYSVQKGLYPDYLAEYVFTYDKKIAAKHKINAVAGYTFQENRYSYVVAGRGGMFTQNIPVLNDQIFRATDISQTYNGAEDGVNQRLMSYFSRINYDFDSRGSLGFSIRRDGSSNFAPKNKFAIFPTVSAAWKLTEEPFIKNSNWINELKVRASFGYTGNQNIKGYAYIQSINQGFQYTFGPSTGSGGVVSGAGPSRSFNPDIKWEKNEQANLGIDATIWKNKLTLALDVYQRRSKDLLLYVAPPLISGTYESVPYNTGIMQNRGVDLTLNSVIVSSKLLKWNANAVFSKYVNKVTSMGLSAPIINPFTRITGGDTRIIQGFPANFFYGFVTDGIFQNYGEIARHATQTPGNDPSTSTAPGDIRFKDINGDGIINNEDRTNIGNSYPTFTFGLTNNITYKNFELTVFIQGSQGNKVLNFSRWYTEGGVSNGNYSNTVLNRWTVEGSTNTHPRVTLNDPNGNNRVSDRFVEDASYVRLKNLRFAYNLSTKWMNHLNLKRAQVYVSGQNLITLTKYTGMDPEVGGGVDQGFYPQARTILAGVTIDF